MKSRSIRFLTAGLAIALGAASLSLVAVSTAAAQPAETATAAAMSNADVIKLTKLGFDSDVIRSKIDQAHAVNFKLEISDLESLKRAGVSQTVIAAMLDRSGGGSSASVAPGGNQRGLNAAANAAMKMGDVTMTTKTGDLRLRGINGSSSTRNAFITVLFFSDYPGMAATARTHDARPTFTVYSTNNPQGTVYLVKLKVNDDDQNRSLKMGNSGFGSIKNVGAPDKDNQIHYDAVQVGDGNEWKLTPTKDLKPGEYGVLYGTLFDFGVDA